MSCCIGELRNKDVICKCNGCRLGFADDVEFDMCSGKITAIIIYGKGKLFGAFGKCDDIRIPWEEIDVIGDDTILVNCECPPVFSGRKKTKWLG